MDKRTKNTLRRLEGRMDILESNVRTLSIRVGHVASHRHEHWAKIRELDIRVRDLEDKAPVDWNCGSRWVRVGSGPQPSKRRLRKVAELVRRAAIDTTLA